MGSFMSAVIGNMERSTAGSEETSQRVLKMCGDIKPKNALFLGDDCYTPRLISEKTGADVLAAFAEQTRVDAAAKIGLNAQKAGAYELLPAENGWDLMWYNGLTEPDGVPRRLEQIRERLAKGGTAVYRTLCWIIAPSPDTKCYVEHRFGRPVPLDEVLREAKEQGFAIQDFYIAPKSDWKQNFYEPMSELVRRFEGAEDDEAAAGIGEINKEIYMFDLHSEEYSFVYYILRSK